MKKLKRILAVALILALCGAGVSYAVKKTSSASVKTVEVCSVQDVNSYYGPSYQDTIEGTIISKDTQAVYLDTEHELKAVYVKEGDKVKKGDKLLEYDMLEEELKGVRDELELGPDSKVLLFSTEGDTDPVRWKNIVWEGVDYV